VPAWWDNWSNTVVIAISTVATVDKIFSGENFTQFNHFYCCYASACSCDNLNTSATTLLLKL